MSSDNKFIQWLFKNLPWIFIVTGLLMLYIGHYYEHRQDIHEILSHREKLSGDPATVTSGDEVNISLWSLILYSIMSGTHSAGAAILGAGIFAAVLKSFQFTGIFQQELSKVIYGTEYLQKQDRPWLESTWRLISKALYTRKFPQIAQQVEDVILKAFFPNNAQYYYKEFRLFYTDVDVFLDPTNNTVYASYTHKMIAKIVPIEKTGTFRWINSYKIESDGKSYRTIELLEIVDPIDGKKDLTANIKAAAATSSTYELELNSGQEYEFTKIEKRKFPLEKGENNKEMFEITKVTDGMIVHVRHSAAVSISFIHKTVSEFKTLLDERDTNGYRLFVKEYKDILLPTQGFCLTLSKL